MNELQASLFGWNKGIVGNKATVCCCISKSGVIDILSYAVPVVDCGLSETAWLLAPPSSDLEAPDTLRRSCADLGLASGGGPASRSPLKSVPPVLTTEAEAYGPSRVSWLLMVYFATLSAVQIIVKSNCHNKSYMFMWSFVDLSGFFHSVEFHFE